MNSLRTVSVAQLRNLRESRYELLEGELK